MVRSYYGILLCILVFVGCAEPAETTPPEVPVSPSVSPQPIDPQPPTPTEATDNSTEATQGPCNFNRTTLSFHGSKKTQAKCLLTPVRRWGELGAALAALPSPLEQIGAPPPMTKEQFRAYLASKNIDEKDLGGSLDSPLSITSGGSPAAYFVIHDTSTPNYKLEAIPADINDATWSHNNLTRWTEADKKVAHVFTNRVGQSTTTIDFSTSWRATKLELEFGGTPSRGRFLHVENIQPRQSLGSSFAGNDAIAPDPGFPEAQYRRLALIYLAASLRADELLVPAFHAVLDSGFGDAHDDPQKFDLDLWAQMLAAELAAAKSM